MSEDNKSTDNLEEPTEKEESVKPSSYIANNVEQQPKNSRFGLYTIGASVLLGASVLGGTIYVKNQEVKPSTTVSSSTNKKLDASIYDSEFADVVNAESFKSIENKVVDFTAEPFNDGYKLDDSHLIYLDVKGTKELLDSGEKFVIYIGRPNCPYCHLYRQVQDKVLKEMNTNIYSIDSIYAKYEKELINMVTNDFGIDGVPSVLVVENGKVIKNMSDDLGEDMFEDTQKVASWITENSK